jgi:hypothetical protein
MLALSLRCRSWNLKTCRLASCTRCMPPASGRRLRVLVFTCQGCELALRGMHIVQLAQGVQPPHFRIINDSEPHIRKHRISRRPALFSSRLAQENSLCAYLRRCSGSWRCTRVVVPLSLARPSAEAALSWRWTSSFWWVWLCERVCGVGMMMSLPWCECG